LRRTDAHPEVAEPGREDVQVGGDEADEDADDDGDEPGLHGVAQPGDGPPQAADRREARDPGALLLGFEEDVDVRAVERTHTPLDVGDASSRGMDVRREVHGGRAGRISISVSYVCRVWHGHQAARKPDGRQVLSAGSFPETRALMELSRVDARGTAWYGN
jgi:hypothetical protein